MSTLAIPVAQPERAPSSGDGEEEDAVALAGSNAQDDDLRVGDPRGDRDNNDEDDGANGNQDNEGDNEDAYAGEEAGEEDGEEGEEGEEEEEDLEPPEGLEPLYITEATARKFEIMPEEDVTEEQRWVYVQKSDMLADIKERGVVSDFHPLRSLIVDTELEALLVVWDPSEQYDDPRMEQKANFFICFSAEAAEAVLNPPKDKEEEEEEDIVIVPVEDLPRKPWVSLGSEAEVDELTVRDTRPKLKLNITRKRKYFGQSFKLQDRDASDSVVECRKFKDPRFSIYYREHDKAVQAVPETSDSHTQTTWFKKRNAARQYEPQDMDEDEKHKIIHDDGEFHQFLDQIRPRYMHALQQNLAANLFRDDYGELAEEDGPLANKTENELSEVQPFTDIKYSKNKTINCVEWDATNGNVVAFSCTEKKSLEERIDESGKVQQSEILIWDFADPIHPQYILEAPGNLTVFRMNPVNPKVIVGGLLSGQVVYWDLDGVEKGRGRGREGEFGNAFGHTDESKTHSRKVRYQVVSSIDWSHKMAVTDLQWLPSDMVMDVNGVLLKNPGDNRVPDAEQVDKDRRNSYRRIKHHKLEPLPGQEVNQFVSVGVDGDLMYWDVRFSKEIKRMDNIWQPIYIMPLMRVDGSGMKLRGLRCSLGNLPPETDKSSRCLVSTEDGEVLYVEVAHRVREPEMMTEGGGTVKIGTPMIVTTEDGDGHGEEGSGGDEYEDHSTATVTSTSSGSASLGNQRLTLKREMEGGQGKTTNHLKGMNVNLTLEAHVGPVSVLERSPFFSEVFLTGGEWSFGVWQWGVMEPLLKSSYGKSHVTSATWSPSRPAVFFIGRSDGDVEMWDLLDRSHEPSMRQNLFSNPVTVLKFQKVPVSHRRGHEQFLLAVGDEFGSLHIMEVPRNLQRRVHHEISLMAQYFEREVHRIEYAQQRRKVREEEHHKQQVRAAKARLDEEQRLAAEQADNWYDDDEEYEEEEEDERAAASGSLLMSAEEMAAEEEYRAMEQEFRRQYGMASASIARSSQNLHSMRSLPIEEGELSSDEEDEEDEALGM